MIDRHLKISILHIRSSSEFLLPGGRENSSSSQLYPYSGSPFLMSLLQELLSWAISSCSPFSLISSPIQSFHLILGLPLFRVPFTSISITSLATCCSSFLLNRWPYHLNLASWTFRDASLTFTDPLNIIIFHPVHPGHTTHSPQHLHFSHVKFSSFRFLQWCCF